MADAAIRIALVLAIVAVAAGIGFLARRNVSYHPPLAVPSGKFDPGLVVFTSTDCDRCKEALVAAKATGAPLREVTYEIEAGVQEDLGVTGVPLTLVIDRSGSVFRQYAGVVGRRRLQRALRRVQI